MELRFIVAMNYVRLASKIICDILESNIRAVLHSRTWICAYTLGKRADASKMNSLGTYVTLLKLNVKQMYYNKIFGTNVKERSQNQYFKLVACSMRSVSRGTVQKSRICATPNGEWTRSREDPSFFTRCYSCCSPINLRLEHASRSSWLICLEHMLTSVLHCRHRPSEVELLFQLLRVFTIRHVPDFHFLRKFLDETVAKVGNFITQD